MVYMHPFVCWWTPRLPPCPGCCKQCCDEHGVHMSFRCGFLIYSHASLRTWICTLLVLFSHSVVSDSLWPCRRQHTRPLCPSSPGPCSNSCPTSQWCHPAISSSIISFSSCPQPFPTPMLWPPDAKNQLTGKDSDAGKDWRQEDLYETLVLAVTYVSLIPTKFAYTSGLIQTGKWKCFV